MLGLKVLLVLLDVVFICIDVEVLERKLFLVFEIGIVIVDIRDFKGVLLGLVGRDWWLFIKVFYFCVKEYFGFRNY